LRKHCQQQSDTKSISVKWRQTGSRFGDGGCGLKKAACVTAIGLLIAANASWASECNDAVDAYNSATQDISSYLRRYANCVADSRGSDDCSAEFRRLRSSQDDFESAVGDYQSNCDQ